MNSYNLYSPTGLDPLRYPHWTKWTKDNIIFITNNPMSEIKVNDVVFVATENKLLSGEIEYSYFIGMKPHRVTEILEKRPARGLHKTTFKPIFQKIKVENIPETQNKNL